MKIFIRTLVILAAAGVIVGATYMLAGNQTNGFSANGRGAQAANNRPQRDGGFRPDGDRERGGGGIFALGEIVKSLAIITVLVAIIAPLTRKIQLWQSRHKTKEGRAMRDEVL